MKTAVNKSKKLLVTISIGIVIFIVLACVLLFYYISIGTKTHSQYLNQLEIVRSPWSGWSRQQLQSDKSIIDLDSISQQIMLQGNSAEQAFSLQIKSFSRKERSITFTINGLSVKEGDRVNEPGINLRDCGSHAFTLRWLEEAELNTCTLDGGVKWIIKYL